MGSNGIRYESPVSAEKYSLAHGYNHQRIWAFFAANSRDVTPVSVRHKAAIRYAPVSRDPRVTRRCAQVLSDSERKRAGRFASENDMARFIQRRAFRRFCGYMALERSKPLNLIAFKETEKGRPYLHDLPDFWFSFSSCRIGFLGAWSRTHGIGIDLEDHTRHLESLALARRYFSTDEAGAVKRMKGPARLETFFRFWSLKEAALKSIGEGLPFGLDAFQFQLEPDLRVVHAPKEHGGPEQFQAHWIACTDGVCAALVTKEMV